MISCTRLAGGVEVERADEVVHPPRQCEEKEARRSKSKVVELSVPWHVGARPLMKPRHGNEALRESSGHTVQRRVQVKYDYGHGWLSRTRSEADGHLNSAIS